MTLTDAAGNRKSPPRPPPTLDATAPSGYSITADQSAINAEQRHGGQLHLRRRRSGRYVQLHRHQRRRQRPVTGSGTISSATQQVTGINVSSLPDGTLTYSVTLTDAAGNSGAPATATATLDQTAPTRLYDHGRPKPDQRQPSRGGRLHLRRRGDR